MDPDPFLRTTFWTMMVGTPFSWISTNAISPTVVQRFLSLSSKRKMRNALILFLLGLCVIMYSNCFIGLQIFARYESCDPFHLHRIEKVDQILPYFIMEVAEQVPGLPGLFVAGIFSAALSTMSSCWNTLAGTIYEDFIHPRMAEKDGWPPSRIMKMIVFILGLSTIALVFLVERMGTVFSLVISIQGVSFGTLLGIFTFGLTCRRGNTMVRGVLTYKWIGIND